MKISEIISSNDIKGFKRIFKKYEKYSLIELIISARPKNEHYELLYPFNEDARKSMIDFVFYKNTLKDADQLIKDFVQNKPLEDKKIKHKKINHITNPNLKFNFSKIDFGFSNREDKKPIEFNQNNIRKLGSNLNKLKKYLTLKNPNYEEDNEKIRLINKIKLRIYILNHLDNQRNDKIFITIVQQYSEHKVILNLFSDFFLKNVSKVSNNVSNDYVLTNLMSTILYTCTNKNQSFLFSDYLIFQRILSMNQRPDIIFEKLIETCLEHISETNQKSHWYFYLLIKQYLEHPGKLVDYRINNITISFYYSIIKMYTHHKNKDTTNLNYSRVLNRLLLTTLTSSDKLLTSINKKQFEIITRGMKTEPIKVGIFYISDFADYERPILDKLYKAKGFTSTFGAAAPKGRRKHSKKQHSTVEKYQSYGYFNIYLPHDRNNYAIQMASKIGDFNFLKFLIQLKSRNPYIDPTCDGTNTPASNIIKHARLENNSQIDYKKCLQLLIQDGGVPIHFANEYQLVENKMIEERKLTEIRRLTQEENYIDELI